jgi:Flp pilus assembly protein TadG
MPSPTASDRRERRARRDAARSPPRQQRRAAAGDPCGQAAVELALALPVLVVFLLGLLQVALVARDQLAVELAAREAARAASVSADPSGAASRAAHRATSLQPLAVDVTVGATAVTVTVRHHDTTDVPIVGPLIADVDLQATATMALEPP